MPRPAKQPEPAADPGAEPPSPDAASVVQVKVWLLGISPMVWRRLLVPDTYTLRELHGMTQVAMGWESIHLRTERRLSLDFAHLTVLSG